MTRTAPSAVGGSAGGGSVSGASAERRMVTAPLPAGGAVDFVVCGPEALSAEELYGILQLRSEVFVVEQDCVYADLDGLDLHPETVHVFVPRSPRPSRDSHGAETGTAYSPAACARLLPASIPDGPAAVPGARSVGRVISAPDTRGTGMGRALLAAVIAEFGHEPLTLNAQAHLERFYGDFGFAVSGEEFIEDGIPHLPMHRPVGG